ncbi:MAG TPA: ABATE domain-containing protein [Steroidobacteraceae bacterium]|jgi:predicted RNA-binding Zn ribbon-like protein|nr:ABATE domain-containing protein [Steroidobacteraceae bacterium]
MSQQFPAIFIADSPGLDFLNSVATPVDVPVDWIDDGEGLLAWLDQAQLVPRATLDGIRDRAMPGELNKVAAQVRDLRDWFRSFVRQHKGTPLTAQVLGELDPLNHLLERDEMYGKVVARQGAEGSSLALESQRRWRSPESLLQPIGEVLASLLTQEDFSHIKACEGPACTLLFADHTRGHTRRWCSMEICGNRAKQAAHRSRLKEQR